MSSRGFTLIELLLAVALLTMLATAAVSWAVSQRRSGARIEERYEQVQQALASRQALHEDLILADTAILHPDEQGRLRFTTLRQMPDAVPGRSEVTWAFDGERQALVRTSRGGASRAQTSHENNGEHRRVVLSGLTSARFIQVEQRGLILELQPQDGPTLSLAIRSWR